MKKIMAIMLTAILTFYTSLAMAGELSFPTTEADIVNALSLKDKTTTYNGVKYESKRGKVYKYIEGKRYRLRGLSSVEDSDMMPKAGALINFESDSDEVKLESYPLLDE